MKKSNNLELLIFASLLASAALIAATGLAGPLVADATSQCWYDFIKDWQTLLSAIIALFGAAITVVLMRKQISSTEKMFLQQRNSEQYAARAIVPLALSSLSDYVDDCISVLKNVPDPLVAVPAFSIPNIPQDSVGMIKECIRFSRKEPAKEMADLLNFLQVQHSRLRDLESRLRSGTQLIHGARVPNAMRDALELLARLNRIYDYGRRTSEENPEKIQEAEYDSAIFSARLPESEYPEVYNLIKVRQAKDVDGRDKSGHGDFS